MPHDISTLPLSVLLCKPFRSLPITPSHSCRVFTSSHRSAKLSSFRLRSTPVSPFFVPYSYSPCQFPPNSLKTSRTYSDHCRPPLNSTSRSSKTRVSHHPTSILQTPTRLTRLPQIPPLKHSRSPNRHPRQHSPRPLSKPSPSQNQD